MTKLENKVLEIVDDDISVIFSHQDSLSFPIGLPIDMQLARSLKKLVALISAKEVQGRNDGTNNGG
jgi:hypothetical protein